MSDRWFRFFGSIKLAVPLLSAIAGILIWATFYESQVGSATVQQEVYKSPWFGALMFLLAVNLGVSALSRYPWRGARKIGFALTHLGLIVIIAGSAAVIHLGVEGLTLLRTDGAANNQIRVEGELLEIINPAGELKQTNVFVKSDGTVSPRSFAGIELLQYNENTVKTVSFTEGAKVANPAVKLSLTSQRMQQNSDRWLAVAPIAYSKVPIGPAELEIVQVDNPNQLQKLLSPSSTANQPRWGKLQISQANQTLNLDVAKSLHQNVKIGNTQIKLVDFWADFRLDQNKQPTSASPNLNNPAVQLQISTPTGVERWFIFGRENIPPVRTVVSGNPIQELEIAYQIQAQPAADSFQVITTSAGELFYTARSSKGFKSGKLELGKPVSPGWADFQITLAEYIPDGQLQRKVVPVPEATFAGVPALLIKTEAGIESWLTWGEPTTINDPEGEIFAAFTPKLLQLPFAIKLSDFIVERNEGTDSVAMWTSKIRLVDPQEKVISRRNVWMNHPTWYRGWKIAQASWNPGDLQQSTLQVKREPAWVTALTWTGSGLVIGGIAVMFYAPVLAKKFPRKRLETVPELAPKTEELTVEV
ncbi:MAG: cytochrome c biogenesis protein ResB [Oscillatoria sp. PMC 1068.18]|nr:cytochrome c biogenesis protein ResB [Oscillatoria sp. PMC 1076.18]MEC4988148.1 cytochrome c biogenesis protein ResB [Oscillatoria sp. PMC 1068.18]